jgi:hypothetical protein
MEDTMGPRVDSTNFSGGYRGAQSVDNQMTDILNNPRLGENDKRKELEKVFSNLTPDDKADMYERLNKRDSKDPVNQAFHYRLSHHVNKQGQASTVDRLLKTLNPDHNSKSSVSDTPAHSAKTGTTKGPSQQPLDDKLLQTIRNYKEEKKTDFGGEIRVMSQDIMKTPKEKVAYARERLEKASPDDLKKIMKESDSWPQQARDTVTEAMRQSPTVMKRIAKEFSPEDQSAAINRSYDSVDVSDNWMEKMGFQQMHKDAMKVWRDNTSDAALNKVLHDTQTRQALSDGPGGFPEIREEIKAGNFDTYKRLDPRNQTEIIQQMIRKTGDKFDFGGIQNAFMVAKDKNAIIDNFQKATPDLLPALLRQMPGLNNDLLEGLNKENAQFLRDTFLSMAELEPRKALADQFRQRAHYLKGWIEESFK